MFLSVYNQYLEKQICYSVRDHYINVVWAGLPINLEVVKRLKASDSNSLFTFGSFLL